MPLDFVCSSCGKHSQVGDQFAGQPGFCNHCGHAVQFPAYSSGAPVAVPKSNSMIWIILLILGGGFLLMLPVIGILIALLFPAVNSAREASRRAMCRNNLKQIGLALLNYESTYGVLPPAYTVDANGQPLHSWRVLILPFLEQQSLYSQIDLNEPWNSPNNLQWATKMPPIFQCPSVKNQVPGLTCYAASTGPGRLFDGAHACKLREILDGMSNTIAVMESPTQVPWLDPLGGASPGSQNLPTGPNGTHPGGVNVLFADGSVQFLDNNTSPQMITAMQTIDGKEPISP